jgi:hypothetical protein
VTYVTKVLPDRHHQQCAKTIAATRTGQQAAQTDDLSQNFSSISHESLITRFICLQTICKNHAINQACGTATFFVAV